MDEYIEPKQPDEILENTKFDSCLINFSEEIFEGPITIELARQDEDNQEDNQIQENKEEESCAINSKTKLSLSINHSLGNSFYECIRLHVNSFKKGGHEDKSSDFQLFEEVIEIRRKSFAVSKERSYLDSFYCHVGRERPNNHIKERDDENSYS